MGPVTATKNPPADTGTPGAPPPARPRRDELARIGRALRRRGRVVRRRLVETPEGALVTRKDPMAFARRLAHYARP